ncbi:MAG: Rab family GTPase [Promethearchaeota archaeon]
MEWTPEKSAHIFKVVLLGEAAVGKTTLVTSFLAGTTTKRSYSPTIGVEMRRKDLFIPDLNKEITLIIWDLAGQKTFEKTRAMFYRGAKGAILVYDVTRPITYEAVNLWLNELYSALGKYVPAVLVGNKIDLRYQNLGKITVEEGESLSQRLSKQINYPVPFIEASALRNTNSDVPFINLSKGMLGSS